ncbi:MAG TPA: DUF1573 domain-containing protein [Gemmataceae bacterium]|jgi:hypothetical protein|nr:DUF1573 domain-containing protein [Gemmataceae bacterium]
MFRYSLVLLMGLCTTAPAAASWADALFDEVSKDFGSVPRGPALTHPFRLVNKTKSPVTIHSLRTSCGCVSASALKHNLQPGEETSVIVTMDTRRFTGIKTVTVYVQFSQPTWAEVRLWVQANSREDITVSPDTLAFGHVKRGSRPTAVATVTFLGDGAARIVDVTSDSRYIQTKLQELQRHEAEVSYQLTVLLHADAPAGKWYADIWLQTNNPAVPRIRVPLTVEIDSPLSVSPATVSLGQIRLGTTAERKVIVRGTQPFRITAVEGTDKQLTVRDSTADRKPVHVLTITFRPDRPGNLDRTLRVRTDLEDEGQVEFQARAQVVP